MEYREFDFEVSENDLVSGSLHLIGLLRSLWKLEDVHIEFFKNGCTNKLLGIWHKEDRNKADMILIRVYGIGTEFIIDRKLEIENILTLYKAGCGARLYATFKNGLAYEYVNGRTVDGQLVRDNLVYPLIASQLAKLHHVPVETEPVVPLLWQKLRHFLGLAPTEFQQEEQQERFHHFPTKSVLEAEISDLESRLSDLGNPVVFCHNDLLLANIIFDSTSLRVSFIDFEYAGPNYMAFDIANHFSEFAGMDNIDYSLYPAKEFQIKWLRCYLESYKSNRGDNVEVIVTDEEVETLYNHVNLFSLTSHLLWGLWALIQAKNSTINFDFLGYALIRIDEFFRRKSLLI